MRDVEFNVCVRHAFMTKGSVTWLTSFGDHPHTLLHHTVHTLHYLWKIIWFGETLCEQVKWFHCEISPIMFVTVVLPHG